MITRRKTRQVKMGRVKIGSSAPISVQSMTKTDTKNANVISSQIKQLQDIGCEIIRVAVKDFESAKAIKKIKSKIKIPLEADIHFNYKLALESIAAGCDGIRLNPGNIKNKEHIREVVKACKVKKIPIRIGVNSGSAGTQAAQGLVKMALENIKLLEKERFFDIMVSLKASDVYTTIQAYRKMAKLCDYPFHLGVTATGAGYASIVKSTIGIGTLLAEGIGDTIRVSLTGSSADEVIIGKHILQSLGLRKFGADVISCPTCGRCQVNLVKIVNDFNSAIRNKRYAQRDIKIALMGCEVNGPGEAKDADAGIAFGKNSGLLFKNGKVIKKIDSKNAIKELIKLI